MNKYQCTKEMLMRRKEALARINDRGLNHTEYNLYKMELEKAVDLEGLALTLIETIENYEKVFELFDKARKLDEVWMAGNGEK